SGALSASLTENARKSEQGKLVLADGKTTQLIREGDDWRLEAPLLSSARAATPQEALRLIASAIEARNFEGVMRLVTSRPREVMRKWVDACASGVKAHLGESIEVTNDRATLIWNDGRKRWRVILRKEEGEWRVDDFDLQQ